MLPVEVTTFLAVDYKLLSDLKIALERDESLLFVVK